MKKLSIYIFMGLLAVVSFTSCQKFLDINENPNSPATSTPELVLPQAIVRVAALVPGYNDYGARIVGYEANAGGVSGWGAFVSYNYTTGDHQGLFDNTYKSLEDLQVVIDLSQGDDSKKAFVASAMILKAYNFQNLVDTYNDIPYTEALKGAAFLQPKYDKAEDIYKALADSLDVAMNILSAEQTSTLFRNSDKLFKGDINSWIKFANTLKLRLIVRSNGKVNFSNKTFNPLGFLTEDAMVNPGYSQTDGKQNPTWNTWAYSASGTAPTAASQRIPTPYVLSFYDGNKITDPVRIDLTFNKGIAVPTNQLGYQGDDAKKGPSPSAWFVGVDLKDYKKVGILKGPEAGQPLMLAAESYFLQAQANLGKILGTPQDAAINYENGVKASFRYLSMNSAGNITRNVDEDYTNYVEANKASKLVDFSLATTDEERLEAIVTQQYIAYNMILGHQAWYEFLRTGYPTITGTNSRDNMRRTFVSFTSESTAANKLPTRILYPASEYKYNEKNVPTGISAFSSKIFWAK